MRKPQQKLADGPDVKPTWANRHVSFVEAVDLEERDGSVVLTNEEPSWEPFWATVEPSGSVAPFSGTLAPRGGTIEFSDTARFEIEPTDQSEFLIVRTEQSQWVYKLPSIN